jgi:hypothetical protein
MVLSQLSKTRFTVLLVLLTVLGAVAVPGPRTASATPTEVDLNFAQIVFDYDNHTNISPTTPDCSIDDTSAYCVGKNTGDIVRFNNAATAGGVSIDAVVETLTQTDTRVRRYEVSSSSKVLANPSWLWVNLGVDEPGGVGLFRLSFYRAGTYTGPGTGEALTLRNVAFSANDINSEQFAQFSEVQGYALTTDTELTFDASLGRFTSSNIDEAVDFPWRYQVVLTYSTLSTLTVGFGRDRTASSANFGLAGLRLPFDGGTVVNFGPLTAASPEPLAGPVPAPDIGFSTTPATTPGDWEVLPSCGVYLPGSTEPLTGTLEPGTYLTRCEGGSSAVFEPTEYLDGELVVTGTPPGPGPGPGPDPQPGPAPKPGTPRFTG